MQQKCQKTEDSLKMFVNIQWLQNKEITTTDNIQVNLSWKVCGLYNRGSSGYVVIHINKV